MITFCNFNTAFYLYTLYVLLIHRFRASKTSKCGSDGEAFIPDDESLRDLLDQSSGSGSGLPLLVSSLNQLLNGISDTF